jgi:hypothetical protein
VSRELDNCRYRVESDDTDRAVKAAVAEFLNVDVRELDTAVVERTRNGFVVRRNAVFA